MSAPPKKLPSFPDVEVKLSKAQKQSAFEKQKAEQEAKRKREAAETAAVYESFVKSFDNDNDQQLGDDDDEISAIARGGRSLGGAPGRGNGGAFAGARAPGKRHFGAAPPKSGPGSLGPVPSTFNRQRDFDGGFQRDHDRRGDDGRGRSGFPDDDRERARDRDRGRDYDAPPAKGTISTAFDVGSDDETDTRSANRAEERAVAKPTLRLLNLPPGTSPAVIKAIISPNLTVESVKILPPQPPAPNSSGNERRSMTAIVILSQETPATDIDAAVSALQNRYLGYGYYLSLHRHLSSAVASNLSMPATSTLLTPASTASQPFGAKAVAQNNEPHNHQVPFHRGFAPPTSYGPGGAGVNRTNLLHVPVQAPRDVRQLQLIHKTIEGVLEHGPEFEALLMSRPDVQREEKWAWLWDARSQGGVWYRWRLWEVVTGSQLQNRGTTTQQGLKKGKYVPLFEGSHAWKAPDKPLAYEYATAIDEFVSDPEYNSSDEDDFEDEGNRQGEGAGGPGRDGEITYLNPLDKARLVHLLARLPTTLTRIRKGDIARVTAFAITHSSRGADEIVDLIVSNVVKPLAFSSANPEQKQQQQSAKMANEGTVDRDERHVSTPVPEDAPGNKSSATEPMDTSAASLVGLYIVSDVISSSATSGVRHSWRFRQLFETALRERRVFEHLGLMAERLGWGRLRADKWKRSVGLILNLWEGWCVFPAESQELFVGSFENPPSAKKEDEGEDEGGATLGEKKVAGKWKTVEAASLTGNGSSGLGFKPVTAEANKGYDPAGDGMDVDDTDGLAMDEDVDEEALMDSDIDGVPMSDVDPTEANPMDEDVPAPEPSASTPASAVAPPVEFAPEGEGPRPKPGGVTITPGASERPPRRRMRAVDMFADDASDKDK